MLLWEKSFRGDRFLWSIPNNEQTDRTLDQIRLADMRNEERWDEQWEKNSWKAGEARRDQRREFDDELADDVRTAASMDVPHTYMSGSHSRHGGVRKDLAKDLAKRYDYEEG